MRPLAIVVDDVRRVREVVGGFLAEAGFDVLTSADGATIMEWALTRRPAVIVIDLVMPTVDGQTMVTQLRRNPRTADVPIVVISGRGEELSETQGFFGTYRMAYLPKPFTREELKRALQEAGGLSPHPGPA
jgi:CheY-like chemotaxis protein